MAHAAELVRLGNGDRAQSVASQRAADTRERADGVMSQPVTAVIRALSIMVVDQSPHPVASVEEQGSSHYQLRDGNHWQVKERSHEVQYDTVD